MRRRPSTRVLVVTGILVSLLIAGVLSWYAARTPDGLQRVAKDHGFSQTQSTTTSDTPLAGYGRQGGRLSGGMAGVIGVAATGLVMGGLVLVLRRRSGRTKPTDLPKHDD